MTKKNSISKERNDQAIVAKIQAFRDGLRVNNFGKVNNYGQTTAYAALTIMTSIGLLDLRE